MRALTRSAIATAWLAIASGCGDPSPVPAPVPVPAPAERQAPVPAVEPAPAPAVAPAPTPGPVLPAPPPPITLAHARELAGQGRHAEAAAVYGALAETDPRPARALSGRAYSLLHVPGGLAEARADLERARALAADDPHLLRAIEHNLELCAERERAGGTPRASACALEVEEIQPVRAATLVEVERALRALDRELWSDEGPADEAAARAALCPDGCDPDRPFVTRHAPPEVFRAHVIAPHPSGGLAVYSDAIPPGFDGRCPDDLAADALVLEGGRWVLRGRTLSNHEEDVCEDDGAGGEDCMTGCIWYERTDVAFVLSVDRARAIRVRDSRPVPEREGAEGAGELATRSPPISHEAGGVRVPGCAGPELHPL